MNNKNNKIIYLFFQNKLIENTILEIIDSLNQFSILIDFKILKYIEIEKVTTDIIVVDNLSYKLIEENNLINNFNKIYVLNEKLKIEHNDLKTELVNIKIPFHVKSLINQIINDYGQTMSQEDTEYKFINFCYNKHQRKIFNSEKALRLTEKENDIFNYFIKSNNEHFSKENLLKNIWNYNDGIDTHTVETHIYVLRKKIEKKLGIKNIIVYDGSGYIINKDVL